jgi:hypothetical protein
LLIIWGLAVETVQALAPDPGMQLGDLPRGCPVLFRPALCALGKRVQVPLCFGQALGHRRQKARLSSCTPLESVKKCTVPMSMPTIEPVTDKGSAGTSSQARITYQRLVALARGRCQVLDQP